MCISYPATLRLMEELSHAHGVPLKKWIEDGEIHQGKMLDMFTMIVGRSRTPAPELSHEGQVSSLDEVPADFFIPNSSDIERAKANLVTLVARKLTRHITGLVRFAKVVPKHILHVYSKEMAEKSEVFALDVLGEGYDEVRRVACGGDQLTCERQVGAQRHMMCGNTFVERLGLLEPVTEDWHCLVSLLFL